jgi:hypothetical protein
VTAADGKGNFFVELLPYLEAQSLYRDIGTAGFLYPPFKGFHALQDYTHDPTQPLLSYGLNSYVVNRGVAGPVSMGGVSKNVAIMPATFDVRGTSNIVGIAERLANDTRSYYGSDVYFYPPRISGFPPNSPGFWTTDATAFSWRGTHVLLMDGSVAMVDPKLAGCCSGDYSKFDVVCSLNYLESEER